VLNGSNARHARHSRADLAFPEAAVHWCVTFAQSILDLCDNGYFASSSFAAAGDNPGAPARPVEVSFALGHQ